MSASYVKHASKLISNTNSISLQSFKLIKALDEGKTILKTLYGSELSLIIAISRLSLIIDIKVSQIKNHDNSFDLKLIEEVKNLAKVLEELTDRKAQLGLKNYDLIDHNMKIVDLELNIVQSVINSNKKVSTEVGTESENVASNYEMKDVHKKRKVDPNEDFLIDPNEPVYCICKKVAFGEMISCDDEECEIEWFHYPCVNLSRTPKDKWICSACLTKRRS